MEKLQLALEKARQKRSKDTPVQATAPTPVSSPSAQRKPFRETAEHWQEIEPIDFNRRQLTRNRIVALDNSHEGEAFDLLRTKTLLQMRKNGWKRLAITSPTMACGKTTTAINFALGMTRQPDKNALLFEMDMRRPSIGKLLNQRPEYNVSDMLNGTVEFASQARRVGDNVALSFNYGPTKNTSQLLMRDATSHQIDAIEEIYQPDITVFDLPPMLASDDTTAFLKNADCVLLIAGAEMTSVDQVDTCEREIAEHTNVLGVVLNKCRYMEGENGYGYSQY